MHLPVGKLLHRKGFASGANAYIPDRTRPLGTMEAFIRSGFPPKPDERRGREQDAERNTRNGPRHVHVMSATLRVGPPDAKLSPVGGTIITRT